MVCEGRVQGAEAKAFEKRRRPFTGSVDLPTVHNPVPGDTRRNSIGLFLTVTANPERPNFGERKTTEHGTGMAVRIAVIRLAKIGVCVELHHRKTLVTRGNFFDSHRCQGMFAAEGNDPLVIVKKFADRLAISFERVQLPTMFGIDRVGRPDTGAVRFEPQLFVV